MTTIPVPYVNSHCMHVNRHNPNAMDHAESDTIIIYAVNQLGD